MEIYVLQMESLYYIEYTAAFNYLYKENRAPKSLKKVQREKKLSPRIYCMFQSDQMKVVMNINNPEKHQRLIICPIVCRTAVIQHHIKENQFKSLKRATN